MHRLVNFNENGIGEKHASCKVELQLRTHLQHVWGTTVEAAGAMRNEDLKAGEGDPNWLRFFTLMSGHIAELERQPRGKHLTMSYSDLKAEAKELSRELQVAQNLQTFSDFMNEAETYDGAYDRSYVLKMDANTGKISMQPAWREEFYFDDLDEQPGEDFQERNQSLEVSVDNMMALRQAYPNYFADTGNFLKILDDLEGHERPTKDGGFSELDLSYLGKMSPEPVPDKELRLLDVGYVYWGDELVGNWHRGNFENHFFRPNMKNFVAVQAEGRDDFMSALRKWLESRQTQ